jgi:hypothetical protein
MCRLCLTASRPGISIREAGLLAAIGETRLLARIEIVLRCRRPSWIWCNDEFYLVLSLLPAVLLQVSLEGAWPALVGAGYVLSPAAVVMHFWEIAGNGAALHQMAL